jgi:soluble lytic murein transglycosylase-like protein
LNSVSASEYHHHYSHAARLAAHHGLPIEASTGGAGFGQTAPADGISSMAAAQASAAGVPASLVERVIRRESGGNPRAVHAGNYGLMQIKLGTARAMGYTGSAAGLLDPQTNMTYAVRYLAGAYRAAGGNESRAVALYASGYYAQAKARGFSPYAATTPTLAATPAVFDTVAPSAGTPAYRARHIRHHAS